ncbi:MAG: FAD-dependent oxidoreductase [Chloroflexi bacterium]|nr:FAD-dependent oxidoreductase [Chloroflexota bacterium]
MSDRTESVRRNYAVMVPDLEYYQRMVECQFACPVHTDARGYVSAIAEGDYERAYLIARETNPFASTCGWVCGAPCEAACRRGKIDAPIAIRALKRFVNDRYGIYFEDDARGQGYTRRATDLDLGNAAFPFGLKQLRAGHKTGQRVAIVGSGPAGLTCAHDLALRGYTVTVFESAAVPGGMLRLGVPAYRLPREIVDAEIDSILALGVELRVNQTLGKDFTVSDLRREFDAVFIGIGTYRSRQLNIEGEELDGVLRSVDFLLNVNLGGYNLNLGKKVLVIGGGNVAMDVARTALRQIGVEVVQTLPAALQQQPEAAKPVGEMVSQLMDGMRPVLDAARTALRAGETKDVTTLVVEARHEMLADPFEVQEAEEEGVVIHNHYAPKRFIGENGRIVALETLDVARAFDEQGRFSPQLTPGTEKIWPADTVIVSIGQVGELSWVRSEDGLAVTRRGTLQVDAQLATTAPGVFAGGDIAFGPRLIIHAVADGHRAARGMDAYLRERSGRNEPPRVTRRGYFTPIPLDGYAAKGPRPEWTHLERRRPPVLPVNRRIGVNTVELSYAEPTAVEQGARCLRCTINTIFDGDLCILCNGCVDVCPANCLKLVRLDQIGGDAKLAQVVEARYGIPLARFAEDVARLDQGAAMLMDPTACIRCGLCANRCPTGAITMESFRFEELDYE